MVAIWIVEAEIMKMFLVVYDSFHDEHVTNAFKQAGYKFYTKTRCATGEGAETLPKLHSHFFPSTKNLLFVAVPDEEIPRIVDFAQILKAENPNTGLRGFIFPLEQCVQLNHIDTLGGLTTVTYACLKSQGEDGPHGMGDGQS